MAQVKVYQLNSLTPHGAWLNCEEDYGQVAVWGRCFTLEVYLFQKGNDFSLRVFDDESFAAEWILDNIDSTYKITKIEFPN